MSVKEVSQTLFCSNTQYLTITTNATISNSPYRSGRNDVCDYNIIAKPNFTTVIMIFYKNTGAFYSRYPTQCSGMFDFTYGEQYITFVNPEDRERIKYCTFDELPVYVITNDTLLMRYRNHNDGMFQDNGFKINVSYVPYGYIIQKRQPTIVSFFTTKTIILFVVLGFIFGILTFIRWKIFMYDKTHDTPYFNMKTDCDYIGKCFAILIIYCGGILVEIIDVLNQFLCKIVYVHCIKTIVYDFLYKKVLMGVIRKFKSVYDLLMARIHCWQTTSVNNVNAIIGNEPKCCVCLKPWGSNLSDVEKAEIEKTRQIYIGLLDDKLNNNNATKITTAILLDCKHSLCFVCAITILDISQNISQNMHKPCPMCRFQFDINTIFASINSNSNPNLQNQIL